MRLLLAAATDWRALIWLGAGAALGAALSNPFPGVVGLGAYLWAAQRLASSPEFQQAAERLRAEEGLQRRMQEIRAAAAEVSVLASGRRDWQDRAQAVMDAAWSIYREWKARQQELALKAGLVEEALKMALLYLKLQRSYHMLYGTQDGRDGNREVRDRGREGRSGREVRTGSPAAAAFERLQRHKDRLERTRDQEARAELLRAIEMEERVLAQSEDEAAEKERYDAKLAALESALELYRRQIFDPEGDQEGLHLHDMLMEAEAMEQAMDEVHRQTRVRAR